MAPFVDGRQMLCRSWILLNVEGFGPTIYSVMRSSHYTVCELKCYYSWSLVIVKG